MHYVRQGDPLGLGHAVLTREQHVGDEPFAVLLGDDLIDPRDPLLTRMIDGARGASAGRVVALMEVPREQIHLYGCAAVEPTDEPDVVEITDLVEKPAVDEAPSSYAVIGRYVLDPAVFDVIRSTRPGPRRRDPAHRRAAAAGRDRPGPRGRRSTGWCSAAAGTTPATGWTTSRRSSGWPASGPTSAPS